MAGIDLTTAEARLTEYMNAEERILANQSYSIGERTLTRANLKEVRDGIAYWDRQVQRLSRGGIRTRLGTPVT
jgi:hypothetical protein